MKRTGGREGKRICLYLPFASHAVKFPTARAKRPFPLRQSLANFVEFIRHTVRSVTFSATVYSVLFVTLEISTSRSTDRPCHARTSHEGRELKLIKAHVRQGGGRGEKTRWHPFLTHSVQAISRVSSRWKVRRCRNRYPIRANPSGMLALSFTIPKRKKFAAKTLPPLFILSLSFLSHRSSRDRPDSLISPGISRFCDCLFAFLRRQRREEKDGKTQGFSSNISAEAAASRRRFHSHEISPKACFRSRLYCFDYDVIDNKTLLIWLPNNNVLLHDIFLINKDSSCFYNVVNVK